MAGYFKVILILGPIIIGIIYLSPVVKKYFKILEPVFQALRISPENSLNIKSINNLIPVNNKGLAEICDPNTREELIKQFCQ